MDHVRGGGQIEACPTGLQRQDEERNFLVFLKQLHEFLALFHLRATMKDEAGASEYSAKKSLKRPRGLFELSKNQDLFLARGDNLGDVA